jgi:hypothetical protein
MGGGGLRRVQSSVPLVVKSCMIRRRELREAGRACFAVAAEDAAAVGEKRLGGGDGGGRPQEVQWPARGSRFLLSSI